MITGTLSNGFNFSLEERKLKTYRFTEILGRCASADANERLDANRRVLPYLIGEDGKEALLEYIEKQTGEEALEKDVTALTIEIINAAKAEDEEIKKSQPSPQ